MDTPTNFESDARTTLVLGKNAVKVDRWSGTIHVEVARLLERPCDDPVVRGHGYDHPLNDLELYAQWNPDDDRKPDRGTYAWEARYVGAYIVDLGRAESMAKALRRIERMTKSFDCRPVTFGQWATMLARKMGIKRVAQVVEADASGWRDRCEYRVFSVDELQYVIDNTVERARAPKGDLDAARAEATA